MRIVLINHYAGSPCYGMEYRPYYMAKEWRAAGHQVSILAGSFSHVRRVNPPTTLRGEEIDGISYNWIPTRTYRGNGSGRFLSMVQFVWKVHGEAADLASRLQPDVIIASSTYPLDVVAALRLSRLAKARLVFEIHDLWPMSPMEIGGMSRWHPFILLMRWAEGLALRSADQVVSMLPYAKSYLISRGMAARKFHYIPNGFYPADWMTSIETLDETARRKIREIRRHYPFIVGYAGSHGAANTLHHFVEAASRLRSQGVGVVLAGHGPEKETLIAGARANGGDNVLFLDPVPKNQIPALLREFDALYIGWRALSLYQHGVSPNKLFDYMMAERPVIHGINAVHDLVAEAQCGVTIPAEDTEAIAEACLGLQRLSEGERARMGRNGRSFAIANHDYTVLANRFAQVLAQ